MEEWKDVKGFEGLYQVSNQGRIKTLPKTKGRGIGYTTKEKIMSPRFDKDGYPVTHFYLNGKSYPKKIHRLVAEAFIPNPLNSPMTNHRDGVKINNNDWNLEWTDAKGNTQHSYDNGLQISLKGKNHPMVKLSDIQVLEIRALKGQLLQRVIAEMYGISTATVSVIQSNKRWKHL